MDKLKIKAQVSIEFAIAFVLLALFIVLAAKMFAWFGSTLVNRHQAYENSRNTAVGGGIDLVDGVITPVEKISPPPVDFFNKTTGKKDMDLFNESK